MSYPKVTDKYPQIGKEDHLFKETDRRVTWDGHRVKRHVMIYHYEGMWTCLWIPHTNKYVYGYSFAFRDTLANGRRYCSYIDHHDHQLHNKHVTLIHQNNYDHNIYLYTTLIVQSEYNPFEIKLNC